MVAPLRAMFALAITLLSLAMVIAVFGILGVAGGAAIGASLTLFVMAGFAMYTYWRRRPRDATKG